MLLSTRNYYDVSKVYTIARKGTVFTWLKKLNSRPRDSWVLPTKQRGQTTPLLQSWGAKNNGVLEPPRVHSVRETARLSKRKGGSYQCPMPMMPLEYWILCTGAEQHRDSAAQQDDHLWGVLSPQQGMASVLLVSSITYLLLNWKFLVSLESRLCQTMFCWSRHMKGCQVMRASLVTTHKYWFTLNCAAELHLPWLHREKCTKKILVVFWQFLTASADLDRLAE